MIRTLENYDVTSRPFYTKALESGKAVWSLFPYIATQRLLLSLSQPIYDENNQLVGVSSTFRSLADVSQFLSSFKISATGEMLIVERSGLLVADSNSEKLVTVDSDGKPQRLKASESSDLLIRQTAAFLDQQSGGLAGINGIQQLDFVINGARQYVQVTPLQIAPPWKSPKTMAIYRKLNAFLDN